MRKSTLIYNDLISTVNKLPNDKAGELFKMILEYVNGNLKESEDLAVEVVFNTVKIQIDRDTEKYNDIVKKRSEAGKKSGEVRAASVESVEQNEQVLTSVNFVPEILTNPTVIEKGKEKVIVKEKEILNEGEQPKRKPIKKTFIPPTLIEFVDYWKENGYDTEQGERAWKGYNASDWIKANGEPVLNWKSTCQHVWFKPQHKTSTTSANGVQVFTNPDGTKYIKNAQGQKVEYREK